MTTRYKSETGDLEVRDATYDDGTTVLDEVIARGCSIHMESMSEQGYLLIIEWPNGRRLDVWIGSRNQRSWVDAKTTNAEGIAAFPYEPRPEATR